MMIEEKWTRVECVWGGRGGRGEEEVERERRNYRRKKTRHSRII